MEKVTKQVQPFSVGPRLFRGQTARLTARVHKLYNSRCDTCGGYHALQLPSMAEDDELPAIYEQLLQRIHGGELKAGMIDRVTAVEVADILMDGIFEGYGQTFDDVAYNTPDFAMLGNLERNVYHFSAAKNYNMLKALTQHLKDGKRVRSYTEFRKEAIKDLDEWVGNWLRTEYDTAVAGGQMASKWVQFNDDKETLPNLEYSTAGDERVRQEHKLLDGVVKPVNDAFWDSYYPPNGWNCRCNVIQSYGSKVTEDKNIEHPHVPKMFKTNLAKNGLAFPKSHPYFNGLPKDVERASMKLHQQQIRAWAKDNLVGKTVEHHNIGTVGFGSQAIKEALNQPHKYMWAKNQAIYDVERLISEGEFIKTVPDAKQRPYTWHYLKTFINNKPSHIVIRESVKEKMKLFYTIVDELK